MLMSVTRTSPARSDILAAEFGRASSLDLRSGRARRAFGPIAWRVTEEGTSPDLGRIAVRLHASKGEPHEDCPLVLDTTSPMELARAFVHSRSAPSLLRPGRS